MDLLLFLLYTIASVVGLLLLKSNLADAKVAIGLNSFVSPPTIFVAIGAILYIISFGVWLLILTRYPLSFAYPIAIGLTLVCSTAMSGVILGEILSAWRLIGILVVFLGITLITRS